MTRAAECEKCVHWCTVTDGETVVDRWCGKDHRPRYYRAPYRIEGSMLVPCSPGWRRRCADFEPKKEGA